MFKRIPGRLGAVSLLLALAASASQAQSSYTLSVLKPTTGSEGGVLMSATWTIDTSQQVTGSASWFTNYELTGIPLKLTPQFRPYATRWAASTSSSVSPTKLYSKQWDIAGPVSPNGRKVVLGYMLKLYDASTRSLVSIDPDAYGTMAVNNDGVIAITVSRVGEFANAVSIPGTWRQGTGLVLLPLGQAVGGMASAINASGTLSGAVLDAKSFLPHAALWTGGALQVLPETPGQASQIIGLNDAGQALVMRALATCPTQASQPWEWMCTYGPATLSMRSQGQELAVDAGAGRAVTSALINGAGVVVGNMVATAPGPSGRLPQEFTLWRIPTAGYDGGGRAYIWRNGVLDDLTTVVASKGVKLPTGAILTEVLAINAQGSLVAVMKAANGSTSVVRLTAKP